MKTSSIDASEEAAPKQLVLDRIRAALRNFCHPQLSAVDCQVTDSTVILSGKLSSFYLKQLAQTAAHKVPGVGQVINQIAVANEVAKNRTRHVGGPPLSGAERLAG